MKLIQRRAYGYRNFKNYPLESTCRMRGETMKGKSKKSTYSTIFGVDPINRFVFEIIAVFPPAWIGRSRLGLARILPKFTVFSVSLEFAYYHRNKLGCRLVALSAKIGLFGGAFINNLRRRNRPRSSVNTGIVPLKAEKVHFSATKSAS